MADGAHVPTWRRGVLGDPAVNQTSVLVALVTSAYMNTTGEAHPSKALLAQGCRLSVRSVDRGVNELEHAGWLRVTRACGRGNRNTYQATFPATENPSPVSRKPVTGDALTPSRVTGFTPSQAAPLSGKTERTDPL